MLCTMNSHCEERMFVFTLISIVYRSNAGCVYVWICIVIYKYVPYMVTFGAHKLCECPKFANFVWTFV